MVPLVLVNGELLFLTIVLLKLCSLMNKVDNIDNKESGEF